VLTPRFKVAPPLGAAEGAEIELADPVAHHALRVLRLRDGDALALYDGSGGEWHARVVATAPRLRVRIERFEAIERESPLAVTLVQAMIAADKLDWVIEKATELGVARILVVAAARSVIRLDGERLRRREARWLEIAAAACSQCGRNHVPSVAAVDALAPALAQCQDADARLVLDPHATAPLHPAAAPARSVALLVGPEGGWTGDELELAAGAGWTGVRFGPRVLRTETAAIAGLAALQALGGDLRG